jgi:hypothetical protein
LRKPENLNRRNIISNRNLQLTGPVLHQLPPTNLQPKQANSAILTTKHNIPTLRFGSTRMKTHGLDGHPLQILQNPQLGLFEAQIKVVASFGRNYAMVAFVVEVDVFHLDGFVFGGE